MPALPVFTSDGTPKVTPLSAARALVKSAPSLARFKTALLVPVPRAFGCVVLSVPPVKLLLDESVQVPDPVLVTFATDREDKL